MRLLAIAPEPFFSPRGTPLSVYYRTLVLAGMGIEVDLLTYGEGDDVDLEGVRIVRIPRLRFLGPVKVGPSLAKAVLDGFLLVWAVFLLLRRRYDAVHAHEESVFFCRFLKPLFGFKLIYDMHSSLPGQLTHFRFTRSRLLIRLFEKLENASLATADAVLTISPALAQYARARMPDADRHFLIENSIFDSVRLKSTDHAALDTDEWRDKLPKDRQIVTYAGTFEAYQGLGLLIEAFARAVEKRPNSFLLLIGGNRDQVDRYGELAEKHGLSDHCLFTGRLPQATTRHLLAASSILTSPRTEGPNTPLKVYEMLALGKPIVATRILAHTQVLTDEVCFLVEPEAEPLAQGILTALDDRQACARKTAAARLLYERRYSRSVYEAKMLALIEALR